MTGRMPMPKLLIAAAAALTALLASTGSAFAGTADYPSTGTFGVPNMTGQAGVPSQVFVPPGRTAVQSLQLTHVKPSFPVGGGLDLEFRLKSPSGTEIQVLANSNCATWPNNSDFTVTDSATNEVGSAGFCAALPNGSGKPNQPFSTFTGQPPAGTWTVTVVDIGLNATQGTWNGWTLQINHANPTLTAAKAPFKAKGKIALTATCDADCTVTTGGAAKATTTKLAQNVPGVIVASPTKKAKKKGKGSVTLTATDTSGGTATTTITAKVGK
jgi:subtilisin-like proprotein convertase family protein